MSPTLDDTFGTPVWHRLHYDLLHHIFAINGDMFSDKTALDTTRRTSQVCRAWREFMLATPSLWGRLIDLDTLSAAAPPWSHELLQRSGNSPIWIMSVFLRSSRLAHLIQFFFDVLDGQWHRIQRLVLKSYIWGADPANWAPLYRAAPYLEICEIRLGVKTTVMKFERHAPGPLFAGAAPVLRELNIFAYSFDLCAPWLSHLRSLNMDGTNFTLSGVVTALQAAPSLEFLSINVSDRHAPPLPPLRLPNLRKLDLFLKFKPCIALLDCIEVPPGCSLRYYSSEIMDMDLAENTMQFLANRLSQFARGHFRGHIPTTISLYYHPTSFRFEDKSSTGEVLFTIYIGCSQDVELPPHALTALLNALALSELSPVTEVQLCLHSPLPPDRFASFLTCLPSLEVIEINELAIPYLLDVPGIAFVARGMVFSALRVVKVSIYLSTTAGMTMRLVEARRDVGFPLAVLDLTRSRSDTRARLDALEAVQGLVVRWTAPGDRQVLEYVCGSGEPERLPF